jgi:L-fucose mutarotase
MPLKGIPKLLTPEILHTLSSMGHGDEIVLADAHFPGRLYLNAS